VCKIRYLGGPSTIYRAGRGGLGTCEYFFLKHRLQSRIPDTEKGYSTPQNPKLGSGKPATFFLHNPTSRGDRPASPPEFSASHFSRNNSDLETPIVLVRPLPSTTQVAGDLRVKAMGGMV
jgi:hypothetical protein